MLPLVKNIVKWDLTEPRADFAEYLKANEIGLLEKINSKGLNITSVWNDLVNAQPIVRSKIPTIIEVLIEAIHDETIHPRIVSGVVATLRHNEIAKKKDLYDFLIELYRHIPLDSQLKNPQVRGIEGSTANAICGHFSFGKLSSLEAIILNDSLGESRVILLTAFEKHLKNKPIQDFLKSLESHPYLSAQAKRILKKVKM